jgi:hypothetical protein
MKRLFLTSMLWVITFVFMSAQTPVIRLVPYKNKTLKLYGYKDSATGKIVVPPRFDDADKLVEGMGRVLVDNKYGYINHLGKLVIPCKYDDADDFSDGMARVTKGQITGSINQWGGDAEDKRKYGYINKKGELVIPFKYSQAYTFHNGLAPVAVSEKWGYVNKTGQLVVPMKYNWASEFSAGVAIVSLNEKSGLIDKTGKIVLPMSDWEIRQFAPGVYRVEKNQKYGLINRHGKLLLDTVYSYIEMSYGSPLDTFTVKRDGKYGYVNQGGKVVVPAQFESIKKVGHPGLRSVYSSYSTYGYLPSICGLYDLQKDTLITGMKYNEIGEFSEGMAGFSVDGVVGYLDEEGQERIPPMYEFVWQWKHGYGLVLLDGKMLLIDKENRAVSSSYDLIFQLQQHGYMVNNGGTWDKENGTQGGSYGLVDRYGKQLTPIKYEYLEEFTNGVARLSLGDTLGLLDTTGKEILLPDIRFIDMFLEGLAMVNRGGIWDNKGQLTGGKWGFINNMGEMVIPARFDRCSPFSEGFAPVIDGDKLGFIDMKGELIIALDSIQEVGFFSEGYCMVMKDELYGYIDNTGKLVIPMKYQSASAFSDGLAIVKENDTQMLIDKKGKIIRSTL